MYTIKQPKEILFGKNSASEYNYPKKSLLITSSGAKKRNWISYLNLDSELFYDKVESNPSIDTTQNIIEIFNKHDFSRAHQDITNNKPHYINTR